MSDKLTLLRDGIPTEIALVLLLVTLVTVACVVVSSRSAGPGNENTLRLTSVVLCILGLMIAGYVAYVAVILGELPKCLAGGGGGCAVVENSSYSKLFGVHISVYGLIGYLSIIGASIWRGDTARLLAFALSLFGFGFSLYLTYLELWEILAICQWCIGSAVLMTLLLVVNSARLLAYYGLDDSPEANDQVNEPPDESS